MFTPHHIYIYIYIPLPWYGYVWNVHRMSIKIEHRNLETRKTRNDFSVQVRNLLLPLSLKVLRHKEREAQSFYSGFFIPPPPTSVAPATNVSASKRKPTVFPRGRSYLNSDFLKLSPNPPRVSGAWGHSHLLVPVSHLGLLWHLWVTRLLYSCAREHMS